MDAIKPMINNSFKKSFYGEKKKKKKQLMF